MKVTGAVRSPFYVQGKNVSFWSEALVFDTIIDTSACSDASKCIIGLFLTSIGRLWQHRTKQRLHQQTKVIFQAKPRIFY
jgi:hypothetical protein